MSSVAQVALGILILGAAFVFGSHIRSLNRNKSVASENAQEASSESDLVWQRPEQTGDFPPSAIDNGGLIDLPVAKRRIPAANDEATTQTLSNEPGPEIKPSEEAQVVQPKSAAPARNPDEAHIANAIQNVEVEPDFSELEMHFARERNTVPASDLAGIAERTEFTPVKPLYSSTDRARVEWPEGGNALHVTEMRSLAPPASDQHRLVELENSTPLVARKLPPNDPNTSAQVRPRVPFGLSPPAKSRLVRLSSARSNRIELETREFVNHVTEAGESLHLLSEKYYGTPDYYLDIYLANQDVLDNPARVPAGATLRIPLYK